MPHKVQMLNVFTAGEKKERQELEQPTPSIQRHACSNDHGMARRQRAFDLSDASAEEDYMAGEQTKEAR